MGVHYIGCSCLRLFVVAELVVFGVSSAFLQFDGFALFGCVGGVSVAVSAKLVFLEDVVCADGWVGERCWCFAGRMRKLCNRASYWGIGCLFLLA